MGTTFHPGQTKAQIIKTLVADQENDNGIWKVLAHTTRGNEHWMIVEFTNKETNEVSLRIGLNIFSKSDGDWGYKSLSEACHPYYYKCPKSYLNQVPVANQDWRDMVLAYHTHEEWKKTIAVGSTYQLTNVAEDWMGRKVTITSMKPLLGSMNGQAVRLQKKLLAPV